MRVDALPDFDGGKLISTDLVLPRADLGQISLCFCWGCGWAPESNLILSAFPSRLGAATRQQRSQPLGSFQTTAVLSRRGSHDGSLQSRMRLAGEETHLKLKDKWVKCGFQPPFVTHPTDRLTPQEVKTGGTWSIILAAEVIDVKSYWQHKLCSYRWKLSLLSYRRLHRSYRSLTSGHSVHKISSSMVDIQAMSVECRTERWNDILVQEPWVCKYIFF